MIIVTASAFHPPLVMYLMVLELVRKLVRVDACLGLVPEIPSLPALLTVLCSNQATATSPQA